MTLTLAPQRPAGFDADDDPIFVAMDPHPGKVQSGSKSGGDTATRFVRVGGVELPVASGGLHIPLGAPVPVAGEQVGIGWEYIVAAVGPYDDPALMGRRFRVVGSPAKSYATARRLDVVEV